MSTRQTILLVDDNDNYIYLLEEILKPLNYNTFKSSNGVEALKILETENIDLVLSDVNMPEMDGLQLCNKIKKNEKTRNVPIVLLSAMKKELDDMVDGLDSGADDYLVKPVDRSLLIAKVKSMLRLKEMNEKLAEAEHLKGIAAISITANHEINNPLTGIVGSVEILREGDDISKEEREKMYDTIYQQAMRISDIVRRLAKIIEPVKKKYADDIDMIDLEKTKYED